MHQYTPLSNEVKEIIFGSILGDGSLKIHPKYENARFSFRHSKNQKEYFDWKVGKLVTIAGPKSTWLQDTKKSNGWGGAKLRFQSQALPSLSELHHLTHVGNEKKIKRKWLNQLTPLSLMIWWCDDGSLVSNTKHGVFCTDGFELSEVKLLKQYLKRVWQINTSIHQVANRNHYRLWMRSRNELQKFLRIIMPHLQVESMLYKVLLLYKDSQLQQRWISEVSKLTGWSEMIIKNHIQIRKDQLKAFRE